MSEYSPTNWYWIVAGTTTMVFSSAIGDYVPVNDPTYQTWLSTGNIATNITSEADLGDVLTLYQIRPVAATVLDNYKDSLTTKLVIDIATKVLFNHENRIRALEAKQPVTALQFKTALKALM